jgi:TRAP transporter 4TM/12TM fusion protein
MADEKKPELIDVQKISLDEAVVAAEVEKHEVESRFRKLSGWQGAFISILLFSMSAFHLCTAGGFLVLPLILQRTIHLMFAIAGVFILFPATQKGNKKWTPWYDWALALCSVLVILYVAVYHREIARRGAFPHDYEILLGIAAIVLILEAGRRTMGNILPGLGIIFLLYCYFGWLMPGLFQIRGFSLGRIIQHMYLTTEGIFGVALGVSSTFVIVFIIFGAFLSQSGGARFFNELALALAGAAPGGPAKVAVVSASLLGTINGSSIANVAATGTFTIPLMKKVGYPAHHAAATVAATSAGAQLMPPIMGAGAFIMAELLAVPYISILTAALIPASLYFTAIFVNLHICAKRDDLKGLPKETLPKTIDVIKQDGHLLLPIAVIVAVLLMRYTPLMAGFSGVVSMFVVSLLRSHTRMGPKKIFTAMVEGARGALGVALACAVVGFVVGTASLTALGLTLSASMMAVAGGNLLPTLIMSMVICIIIGLGLPTTAKYIVTSTIIAPVLTEMGIPHLAAHLFLFYFAIMADITPPVCLAVFTAAGIAGADPAKSSIAATRITLASYLLPFIFIYNPMLLLMDVTPFGLTVAVVSSLLGIWTLAGSLEGWLERKLAWYERIIMACAAFSAIHPDIVASIAGVAFIVLAHVYFRKTGKQVQAA